MDKICPKCGESHEKKGTYCSYKCANSRVWTESDKAKKSVAAKNSVKAKAQIKELNRLLSTPEKKAEMKKMFERRLLDTSWTDIKSKRNRVILEQNNCCNRCGRDKWEGEIIPLELEHKDGNNKNNDRDNLEALCPNCHALTDTWRGRNKGRPKNELKVEDEELIFALENTKNIHQALIAVGLTPKGNNYKRAKRLKNIGN